MAHIAESSSKVTSSSNGSTNVQSKEVKRRRLEDLSFSSPGPAFMGTPSSSDVGDEEDSDAAVRRRPARMRVIERKPSSTSFSDPSLDNTKNTSSDLPKSSPLFRNFKSSIFRNFDKPNHINGNHQDSNPAPKASSARTLNGNSSPDVIANGPSVTKTSIPQLSLGRLPKASKVSTRGKEETSTTPRRPSTVVPTSSNQLASVKKERLLSGKKQELDRVYRDHDGLVRELFHLTKFVTYFGFDPELAAQDQSDVFERFRMDYDLTTRLSGASGRATRRIVSAKRGDLDLQKAAEKKRVVGLTKVDTNGREPSESRNGKGKEKGKHVEKAKLDSKSKRGPGRPKKTTLIRNVSSSSSSSDSSSSNSSNSDSDSSDSSSGGSHDESKRVSIPAKRARKKPIRQGSSMTLSSSPDEDQAPPKKKVLKPPKRAVSVEYVPRVPVVMERIEGIPRSRVMLPAQLPLPPRHGGSLAAYLQSWHTTGEYLGGGVGEMEVVPLSLLHQREARDAWLYNAIEDAKAQGLLQDRNEAVQKSQQNRTSEAQRRATHWDTLLQEILSESARKRVEARNKSMISKRVARMIHLYWDEKLGRGERQKKVEERRIRALAKYTVREVRKQWKLAVNVIKARRAIQDKEEKDRAGREQLKTILEQSTQMLGKQHRALVQGEADSEEMESNSDSQSEESDWDSFTDEDEDSDIDDGAEEDTGADQEDDEEKRGPEGHLEEAEVDDDAIAINESEEHESEPPTLVETEVDTQDEVAPRIEEIDDEMAADSDEELATKIKPPFLLRGNLRPYQQIGFEWLANLYNNGSNGILADEMGLGKTIQTISVLAHLACDKGEWGPHLVVAPTSVMLNWEVEFKKFLPGFKILSYYGSQKERKEKRRGWNSDNHFNVCITSYQLVLADQHILRRKAWQYLILDEAHHIKNFKSQRWQTLLGFNSKRRLLLTGTPLQNNLMDLWSLMYFLMPNGISSADGVVNTGFASMKEFQQWFSNPLGKAVENAGLEGEEGEVDEETKGMVSKLHTLLRPYLLRRMKTEVEKELPNKYEHVIKCRLSKRQKFLYNDFMSRAKTRESLASGNYLSIINCLMQLRKVCNHPDLFEQRPIVTSFASQRSVVADFEIKELLVRRELLQQEDRDKVSLGVVNLHFNQLDRQHLTPIVTRSLKKLDASALLPHGNVPDPGLLDTWTIEGYKNSMAKQRLAEKASHWKHAAYVNHLRCQASPPSLYDDASVKLLQSIAPRRHLLPLVVAQQSPREFLHRCDSLHRAILTYDERRQNMQSVIDRYAFVTPRAVTNDIARWALPGFDYDTVPKKMLSPSFDTLHEPAVKLQIAFPDASLLQYDCGKLQELALLMQRCKAGGHRILIFTQMTKILDILETWLSFNGFKYLRLDGSTKVEDRQALTERFNRDDRITAFILSTRSGGLGINLTGANMVLFWDLDWNFQIEAQCMDRAHRIGQTRDVHIYRFVSEYTIEENMLKKSNEKRMLDNMVIQNGQFTTEGLSKMSWIESMFDEGGKTIAGVQVGSEQEGVVVASDKRIETAMNQVEDEEDAKAAKRAQMELHLLDNDFETEMNQDKQTTSTAPQEIINQKHNQVEQAELPLIIQEKEGEEEEEEGGTVDDFMLKRVDAEWDYFVNL